MAAAKKGSPPPDSETFGRRTARLRKAAGYSQRSLSEEIGVSYRVIAYYAAQTTHPPTHLLSQIADALRVSTDQLLGRQPITSRKAPTNERLMRRLRKVEKLRVLPATMRDGDLDGVVG